MGFGSLVGCILVGFLFATKHTPDHYYVRRDTSACRYSSLGLFETSL